MKLPVVSAANKKVAEITLSDRIWAAASNPALVAQAIHVYRANLRQSPAKTKTRGEVSGSGRKIWRQKGTGRARHGDRYAPIFVGGGVAHGPTGKQNYKKRLNQKMRRQALFITLSDKAAKGRLTIINKLPANLQKTKQLQKILSRLSPSPKVLLVSGQPEKSVKLAGRNISAAAILPAHQLNALKVLENQHLILTKSAAVKIQSHFLKEKKPKN